MKKKHLYMIAMSAILSVITLGSVKRALFFDTKIAYADPSITYIYGADGSEHAGLNNFYPKHVITQTQVIGQEVVVLTGVM